MFRKMLGCVFEGEKGRWRHGKMGIVGGGQLTHASGTPGRNGVAVGATAGIGVTVMAGAEEVKVKGGEKFVEPDWEIERA